MSSIYPVTVPKWGIEMQEGTITEWRIAQGEPVSKGDELVDIETDKIVNTMEAPVDGLLARIIAEVDETLKVGQLLGVIADSGTTDSDIDAFIQSYVPADASFGIDEDAAGPAPVSTPPVASSPPSPQTQTSAGEVKISPVARRLADKLGVDVSSVEGTGRNGRISTADIEAAAANGEPGDAASSAATIALTARELTAGRRLAEAKQAIPHFYLQRDLDMRNALEAKERLSVPMTALIIKALAMALEQHPRVNSHLKDDALHQQPGISINVAVDTPDGLVAPLLKDIGGKDESAIADSLKKLAERAREKALDASDLAAGGITLSNLGMFGIASFSAIINPPQVAILAVGNVHPVMLDSEFEPVQAMTATLSCDHRAIDGASGARFLASIQDALNTL